MRIAPNALTGEAARFVIAGGFVTLISAAAYWLAATSMRFDPLVGSVLSHCVGVLVGFRIHAHWTFGKHRVKGPGFDENLRFLLASATPLLCNAVWVLLLVKQLALPKWTPMVPMVFATPVLTFAINRTWVFGASRSL